MAPAIVVQPSASSSPSQRSQAYWKLQVAADQLPLSAWRLTPTTWSDVSTKGVEVFRGTVATATGGLWAVVTDWVQPVVV